MAILSGNPYPKFAAAEGAAVTDAIWRACPGTRDTPGRKSSVTSMIQDTSSSSAGGVAEIAPTRFFVTARITRTRYAPTSSLTGSAPGSSPLGPLAGWDVAGRTRRRVLAQRPTQEQAIATARGAAIKEHEAGALTQLTIQRPNGQWGEEWTYGADPRNIPG